MGTSAATSTNASLRTYFTQGPQTTLEDCLHATLFREDLQAKDERAIIAKEWHSSIGGNIFANPFTADAVISCAKIMTMYASKKFGEALLESPGYEVTPMPADTADGEGTRYHIRRNGNQKYVRTAVVTPDGQISVDCNDQVTSGKSLSYDNIDIMIVCITS